MARFGTPVLISADRAWKVKLFMNIDLILEYIHLRYIQFFASVKKKKNPGRPGVINSTTIYSSKA